MSPNEKIRNFNIPHLRFPVGWQPDGFIIINKIAIVLHWR